MTFPRPRPLARFAHAATYVAERIILMGATCIWVLEEFSLTTTPPPVQPT